MSLTDFLASLKVGLAKVEAALDPQLQPDAVAAVSDVKSLAETGVDAEVTAVAPTLAPEVLPIINGAIDDAAAKIDADLAAAIATLQSDAETRKASLASAKTALAGAPQ